MVSGGVRPNSGRKKGQLGVVNKGGRLNIRISSALLSRLRYVSNITGSSQSDLVESALTDYFSRFVLPDADGYINSEELIV